jgi:hypothetical protein
MVNPSTVLHNHLHVLGNEVKFELEIEAGREKYAKTFSLIPALAFYLSSSSCILWDDISHTFKYLL